ncbi:cupin domain-containing protein, partial [Legionella drancourtii]|uniref:AraC-type arabinose-binding/dimerisation domain-containing protein n=1 Tax=Legionella drancourtii LLAP12 TaxID=658187 RepID=G9EKZ8_9GAMM
MNKKCKELVYVQNGTGKVVVNNIEYLLNVGDVVLIEAGEKFYWEGNLTLSISCNPAFNIEQHQIVD